MHHSCWRSAAHVLCLVAQSCPTLCDPMDSTIHGILQARILEWVAMPSSRGSSWPRDPTQVFRIAGRFFALWAPESGYAWASRTPVSCMPGCDDRCKKRAHKWVPPAVGQGAANGEERGTGEEAEWLCWWAGLARVCRLSAGSGCLCRDPVVRVFDDWTKELGIFLFTVESSKESFFIILERLCSNYYFLLFSLKFTPCQKFVIWRNIFKKTSVWSYMKKKWVRRETRCIRTEWQTRHTPRTLTSY